MALAHLDMFVVCVFSPFLIFQFHSIMVTNNSHAVPITHKIIVQGVSQNFIRKIDW